MKKKRPYPCVQRVIRKLDLQNWTPATIKTMLDFAAHHNIEPVTETFKFDDVNSAIERLREGKAHYRVVLTK